MLGTVQMSRQKLTSLEVTEISKSLYASCIRLLSLRECSVSDKGFMELMMAVGQCKSLVQLNLNLGLLKYEERAENLAKGLNENRSLKSLFLHGAAVGKRGIEVVIRSIILHPNIISLDTGNCSLDDDNLCLITQLLRRNGAKPGLTELILSGNDGITSSGWLKFFIAMTAENHLKTLCLDYNTIGDEGMKYLCIALVSGKHLHTLDLENIGITKEGGMLLLDVLQSYTLPLRELVVEGNHLPKSCINSIKQALINRNEEEISEETSESVTSAASASNMTDDQYSTEGSSYSEEQSESMSDSDTDAVNATQHKKGLDSDFIATQKMNEHKYSKKGLNSLVTVELESDSSVTSKSSVYTDSDSTTHGFVLRSAVDPRYNPNQQSLCDFEQQDEILLQSPLHTINAVQHAYSNVVAS